LLTPVIVSLVINIKLFHEHISESEPNGNAFVQLKFGSVRYVFPRSLVEVYGSDCKRVIRKEYKLEVFSVIKLIVFILVHPYSEIFVYFVNEYHQRRGGRSVSFDVSRTRIARASIVVIFYRKAHGIHIRIKIGRICHKRRFYLFRACLSHKLQLFRITVRRIAQNVARVAEPIGMFGIFRVVARQILVGVMDCIASGISVRNSVCRHFCMYGQQITSRI